MVQEPWEFCPPPERLKAYALGELEGKFNEWTYRHLKFCSKCLRRTAKIRRVPSPEEIICASGLKGRILAWLKRIRSPRKRG